jgi:hypothetical protein
MNLHAVPNRDLLTIAFDSRAEAEPLTSLPAWRDAVNGMKPGTLPMIAIDAARGVAALSHWDVPRQPPLVLLAPPLAGISRAVGLRLIVDAFGYRRFDRAFGHETVFSNPDYINGHRIASFADVERHVGAFAAALGVAAFNQPPGTIWDVHAPVSAQPVLANAATRVIVLARDPRDVTVSAYFFFKRTAERGLAGTASLTAEDFTAERKERTLIALIDRGYTALSGSAIVHHQTPRAQLAALARCFDEPRAFVIRYEHQHTDAHGQYGRLIDWLSAATGQREVPDRAALVAEAVARGTFARQTDGAMAEGRHDEAPAASPTGHLRKGIVGDWKTHFTPAVRRAFHDSVGRMLLDCGFETNHDWWKD